MKVCKDCAAEGLTVKRPLVEGAPGPRCMTHWRVEKRRRSAASHARTIVKAYGLSAEQYNLLYQFQGGRCFVCQRATGKTKRLAVDHDHATGAPRALLCGPCNRMIGFLDVDALARAIVVLTNPPARQLGIG